MNTPITADRAALLTDTEQRRLTAWMQAYCIAGDSDGHLTFMEAKRVLFVRYLLQSGRLDNPAIG